MRRLFLFGLLLPGCCFIGCEEEALFRPASTVTVTDASGKPLAGASVTVARYEEHPHFRPLNDWSQKVGADGKAGFERETGTVKQYPLMMHGVAGYAWQFCAEAPGYESQVRAWNESKGGAEPVQVTFELSPGESDPCSEVVQFEPFDPSPVLACETDADCVLAEFDENCCELCYGQILNAKTKAERESKCGGTAAASCTACEVPVDRSAPPRCLAGMCREPK